MLVSKKLLENKDNAFKKIDDKKFQDICNKVGIEIEKKYTHKKVEGLEIAKIISIKKHPNADKLNLATLKTKNGELEVVCGADNLKEEKYVIYAPVGTKFSEDFIIQPRSIRGVTSNGMICAFSEITDLGKEFINDNDKNGIILIDEAVIGDTDIEKYIGTDDEIYDLSIASNRNDLNSHELLANELMIGINQKRIVDDYIRMVDTDAKTIDNIDKKICSDFSLIHIKNAPKYKTDWKQKQILQSLGYKVHNNWLDFANLMTIYFGNPIHIYDATDISPKDFSVKLTDEKTTFIALDNKTYEVNKGTIGVFINNKLSNIAGIMGDELNKYTDSSNDIIIEVANFDNKYISKTNDYLKINSKSSILFSKKLSSWITQNTYNEILKYLNKNSINYQAYKNFEIISVLKISYENKELYNFLGIDEPIHYDDSIGLEIYNVHPSRLDLENQYDVFEEVLKTIDVNKLKVKPISFDYKKTDYTKFDNINKIRSYLNDYGFLETKTYNLIAENKFDDFNIFGIENKINIMNPISKIRETFRSSLVNEHLDVISYNQARKRKLFNIYEIQNLYYNENEFFNSISITIYKDLINNKVAVNNVSNSLMNLRTLINNMFAKLNVKLNFKLVNKKQNNYETIYELSYKNKKVGSIIKINKNILSAKNIEFTVYNISINLDKLLDNNELKLIDQPSLYPTVERDFNITNKKLSEVKSIISSIGEIEEVIDCEIKDIFKKENNNIYTVSIKLVSKEKTLGNDEIEEIVKKINNIINSDAK